MDETFVLSNISPQVGKGFNRDYWARLEKFVRDLTRISSDVYVVTGPLWMPTATKDGQLAVQYPVIGAPPATVSVPTHFFKVGPSPCPLPIEPGLTAAGRTAGGACRVCS